MTRQMMDCTIYGTDWWIAYGQGFCNGALIAVILLLLSFRKTKAKPEVKP